MPLFIILERLGRIGPVTRERVDDPPGRRAGEPPRHVGGCLQIPLKPDPGNRQFTNSRAQKGAPAAGNLLEADPEPPGRTGGHRELLCGFDRLDRGDHRTGLGGHPQRPHGRTGRTLLQQLHRQRRYLDRSRDVDLQPLPRRAPVGPQTLPCRTGITVHGVRGRQVRRGHQLKAVGRRGDRHPTDIAGRRLVPGRRPIGPLIGWPRGTRDVLMRP